MDNLGVKLIFIILQNLIKFEINLSKQCVQSILLFKIIVLSAIID